MHLLQNKCHDFNYGNVLLPSLAHTQGECILGLFSSSSVSAGVRKFIQNLCLQSLFFLYLFLQATEVVPL